ncbi:MULTISPECIES: hypothetical protein [Bacillus]|uniref:hypothetical protein n=1 Tax=Bacillus TaxID=1386 RepID=UPI001573B8C9|nr:MULTISPECIES: hypothetical protein [Bacillus]MBC6975112.1 hypothetical protein [Bacillus sp. Xin]MBY0600378.1 hypothetical protein [Bacillus bingmayongensis]NSW38441.1 hypothetical protein [Bacillus sp. Xin1]
MANSNEKVLADKVLEQLEIKIDLVATKLVRKKRNGETSFLENRKEFEVVEELSKSIMNILHPVAPEQTMVVNNMLHKTSQLLDAIEAGTCDLK